MPFQAENLQGRQESGTGFKSVSMLSTNRKFAISRLDSVCSGLAIHRDDLGHPIAPEKYPFLHTLFDSGVTGLFELVSNQHDFKPSGRYMSKCHLCLDIRRYLVLDRGLASRDLEPKGFYENI